MIAEPPPLTAPVFAPGKEAEIAELAQEADDASAQIAVLTASLVETMQNLFAVLPAEKQGDVLVQFAEYMSAKNAERYGQIVRKLAMPFAVHPLAASFGALKDDPVWDEYETALRELKEEDRKRAQEMYPEANNEAV